MNEPRILIVEDERIVAADISARLKQMGYQPVGQAASGEKAIALAGELRPDLVLMDIRLEGEMDGIAAANEIRQRFHIPSVFLSAYSEETTIQRAKLAEPFGYILKPFEGRELRATIETALYKHRTEEALRKSEARLKFALETTQTGAWELDLLDHQMERTLTHDRIFGYETLLPSWSYERFLEHVLPEDRPEVQRKFRQAVTDQSDWSFECRIRRADGKVRWIWVRGGHERDFEGKVNRMSGLVRDITERKRLEDRAQQFQKMETIGYLTGGMAHQFNNILAAVMMNLELVQTLSPGAEARELLGGMLGSCQRAADLIKQLLAFSRQSVMRPQPMDLAAMVSKQCQVLDRLAGERITLEFSSADKLPWVNADMGMMEQVLFNLCLNARDAMKEGGLLQVRLTEAEVGAEQAKAHEKQPGRHVCLSVTDNGCGMDDQTMQRLFEPFFTTKDIGQGTGMGLATVRGMVQQHGGWVEVESCVGKGSTFQVYLPAVAQPPAAPAVPQVEKVARGQGTILVVEDEPEVRRLTGMILVKTGYKVFEAADGPEALELWRKHRAEIDLLYTDMVMPGGLSGIDLAQRVLGDKPGVKVIITSGYNTEMPDLSKATDFSLVYLPKPSPAATLLSLIQRCLQRKPAGRE